jgi:hypothetical protein
MTGATAQRTRADDHSRPVPPMAGEDSPAASERTPPMVRESDSRFRATPVPHGAVWACDVDDTLDAETVDVIAVGVVSPEGMEASTKSRFPE